MQEQFKTSDSKYNLLRHKPFAKKHILSWKNWINSLVYLAPKIWDLVPIEMKVSEIKDTSKQNELLADF